MRSTKLKDAMRDNCLEELMNACIQLTSNLHSSNPDLAASVLEAVARFVNWIDIRLVANDRSVIKVLKNKVSQEYLHQVHSEMMTDSRHEEV